MEDVKARIWQYDEIANMSLPDLVSNREVVEQVLSVLSDNRERITEQFNMDMQKIIESQQIYGGQLQAINDMIARRGHQDAI